MKIFGKKITAADVDQVTREDRDRIRELTTRNLEVSKLNVELTRANVELSREVIRLSQRVNPVISEEDIKDPPTTREADMLQVHNGEKPRAVGR